MNTKVDYSYLSQLAQTGDDNHKMLVSLVSNLVNELRYHQNEADELAYELQQCLAENKFLIRQMQEET